MDIDRVSCISADDFIASFLHSGLPVIVTDAMTNWQAPKIWTPDYFATQHGKELIPVYGTYFDLRGTMQLASFVRKYMGDRAPARPAYARWFTRHQAGTVDDDTFPWANKMFEVLRNDWEHPYFMPRNSYLFPFCSPHQDLDVSSGVTVPSKALYLSGKGAVTDLHFDYWGSDAVLCQIYGNKEFTLYSPDQYQFLVQKPVGSVRGTSGGVRFVNIKAPDKNAFPEFHRASPSFVGTLNPGEIIYIPAGWLHHVDTVSPSITITWNFVHSATWRTWFTYLMTNVPESELADINYILHNDPGRLP